MTSEERRELRYQRRKARREEKKAKACAGCDNFAEVFSYAHLFKAYRTLESLRRLYTNLFVFPIQPIPTP